MARILLSDSNLKKADKGYGVMENAQILIVEDDTITAMDIENQLKNLGYGVTAKVAHGEDAIKQVKENTPDLVLMDIVLKGDMDGIEAADEIRSQFDIPVVFLTAYADRKRLERAKLTTPFGYIIKPFQDKDFRVTIEMALYIAKVDAERKRAEEALQESEAELFAIYNDAPITMILFDEDRRVQKANQLALESTDRQYDEIVGLRCGEALRCINATDPAGCGFGVNCEECILNNTVLDSLRTVNAHHNIEAPIQLSHSDGVVDLYFLLSTSPLNIAGKKSVLVCLENITEQKQAEEALRQVHDELEQRVNERTAELAKANEELKKEIDERKQTEAALRLYEEIIENMAEGVYLIRTSDGVIVYTNPQFERMFGYDSEELKGKHVSIVNAPTEKTPEEIAKEIIQSLKEKGTWSGEVLNIKKDGTQFWCHANVSTFDHHEFGEVWISVHNDITEQKLTEEKN